MILKDEEFMTQMSHSSWMVESSLGRMIVEAGKWTEG